MDAGQSRLRYLNINIVRGIEKFQFKSMIASGNGNVFPVSHPPLCLVNRLALAHLCVDFLSSGCDCRVDHYDVCNTSALCSVSLRRHNLAFLLS